MTAVVISSPQARGDGVTHRRAGMLSPRDAQALPCPWRHDGRRPKGTRVNKNELVEVVAGKVGDRQSAAAAVDAVLATVVRTVRAGDKVALSGFGVFEKTDRAARTARNPATGATINLAATSVPRFRAGQAFKDVVSGARELPAESEAAPAPRARPRTARPVAPGAAAGAAAPEAATVSPARPVARPAPVKDEKAGGDKSGKKDPAKKAPVKKDAVKKDPAKKDAVKKAGKKDAGKEGRKKSGKK